MTATPTVVSGAVAGTAPLLRASLRHDARSFAPWVVIATALTVSSVIAYPLLYPDLLDRQVFAATVGSNPALGLIFGPAFDLSTVDGFTAWRSLALGGFITALEPSSSSSRPVADKRIPDRPNCSPPVCSAASHVCSPHC